MTLGQPGHEKPPVNRAVEAAIDVGLVALLATACLLVLLPFLPLIAWGIIIAVALYPAFMKLGNLLGGRQALTAALCTLILLAVLILPAVLLTGSLVEGIGTVTVHLKDGTVVIPPPPANIESWPIIGAPLRSAWGQASGDSTQALKALAPRIKALLPQLLSASAGIGLSMLQFFISILVAGALLANARRAAEVTSSLANRLFGSLGPEFQQLVGSTIRSVTFGILGVALIQSVCAGLGFLVAGLPGAGLWAVVFLFTAVCQAGILVLVPAVIYVLATASATKAVIFLMWCIFVGLMDNILKPLLLGRGVGVPVVLVFLGAIGGFIAVGLIGLFVGAIVLSVGYKLFLAWLEGAAAVNPETSPTN